jgi:hypothetical protein
MIAPTDVFLEKPFTQEILVRTVRDVLDTGSVSGESRARAMVG